MAKLSGSISVKSLYKIKISKDGKHVLVIPRNETMPQKKQNIYERHSKFCLLSLLLKMIYILLNNLKRKKIVFLIIIF